MKKSKCLQFKTTSHAIIHSKRTYQRTATTNMTLSTSFVMLLGIEPVTTSQRIETEQRTNLLIQTS